MTEVTSTSGALAAAETAGPVAAIGAASAPAAAPVDAHVVAMAAAAMAAAPSAPAAKPEVSNVGPAAAALAAIEAAAAVEAATAKKAAAEAKKKSDDSEETSMSDAEVAPEVELATLGEASAAAAGQPGLPCGVLPVVDAPVAVAPVEVPVADAGFALSPALLGLLGLGALGLGWLLLRDKDDDDDDDVDPPVDENDAPVAVDETITATEDGAEVEGELNATDADGDDLTYELDDDVAGLTLNEDGTYTFDPAAADLDHLCEGDTQTITANYTVTDEDDATDVGTITITVTGVNDLPVVTSAATGTVAENAATTTVVYTATVTDADGDEPVEFSLAGADAALFTIDPATGQVRLINSADFEANADYNITIVATDDCGGTDTQNVVINVTDVDEGPDTNVVLLDDEDDDANPNTAAEFDASGGAFILGDDADQPSTTIITGFGDDDLLVFEEGADVFFSSSADDPNDLEITVNEGGVVSQVILDNVLDDDDFVFDEETAEDALGFDFFEQAPVGTDFADTNFA